MPKRSQEGSPPVQERVRGILVQAHRQNRAGTEAPCKSHPRLVPLSTARPRRAVEPREEAPASEGSAAVPADGRRTHASGSGSSAAVDGGAGTVGSAAQGCQAAGSSGARLISWRSTCSSRCQKGLACRRGFRCPHRVASALRPQESCQEFGVHDWDSQDSKRVHVYSWSLTWTEWNVTQREERNLQPAGSPSSRAKQGSSPLPKASLTQPLLQPLGRRRWSAQRPPKNAR